MADQANGSPWSKAQFHMIETTSKPSNAGSRDPAGALANPSGLTPFNTAASDWARTIADDLGLERWGFRVGGNEEAHQVACWIVDAITPGVQTPKEYPDRGTLGVTLHDLYKAKPRLRPDAARWVTVTQETDSDGDPFLLISLAVPLGQRLHHRRGTARTPAPAPEPQAPPQDKPSA